MANAYFNLNPAPKVNLYEDWLEHKSIVETKWKRYWIELRDKTLYFYTSRKVSRDAHTASIKIEDDFKFEKKEGSEKGGYKFDIHSNKKIYKFKSSKFSERELWKAYLEGVSMGRVSDDIDLPPESLVQVRISLDELDSFSDQAEYVDTDDIKAQCNIVEPNLNIQLPPDRASADSGCVEDYLEPIAKLNLQSFVFYSNSNRHGEPSWFFKNCSREMGEEILLKGFQYGNTLMRKGAVENSFLVISKKMENRKEEYNHFVVDVLPDGYKLRVENPHQPMKSLTDIMNFFVLTSGSTATKPMTCNDVNRILSTSPEHDYNPVIIPSDAGKDRRSQSHPDITPDAKQLAKLRKNSSLDVGCFQNISDIPPIPPVNPPPPLPNNHGKFTHPHPRSIPPPLPPNHPQTKTPLLTSASSMVSINTQLSTPLSPNHPEIKKPLLTPSISMAQLSIPPPLPANHPQTRKHPFKHAATVPNISIPPSTSSNQPQIKKPLQTPTSSVASSSTPSSVSSNQSENDKPSETSGLSVASIIASYQQKNPQQVAPKRKKDTSNDLTTSTTNENGPVDEFKKKLEMMLGGNKSQTLPATKPNKIPNTTGLSDGHKPDGSDSSTRINDSMYHDTDHYQNAALVKQEQNR